MKVNLPRFLSLVFMFLFVSAFGGVHAAVPDGMGPWADSVVSFSQGFTKSGGTIPAARSDASASLGVAENDTIEPHFVSLGFGGVLTLKFDNGFKHAVVVVEATNPGYPTETADIKVSIDGFNWVNAGSVATDGQVNVPSSIGCARYVRIIDTSDKSLFEDTADGYDVDGVRVTDDVPCIPPISDCCCNLPVAINVSGNGAGSKNTVKITSTSTKIVGQSNSAVVTNLVNSSASTGKNKEKSNTKGNVSVVTGNSSSFVSLVTLSGSNIFN